MTGKVCEIIIDMLARAEMKTKYKSKLAETIDNIRFEGEKGEQATFFIKDPSDNILEFKAFKNDKMIFDN